MPSQMNGCHVPGQTGAIQNPAYRPTGKFPFLNQALGACSARACKHLKLLIKQVFMGGFWSPRAKCLNGHGKPFVNLNGI